MSKGSLAYDLSKYENAAPKLTSDEKAKIKVRKAKPEAAGSAPRIIVLALAAGLLLGLVIYGKVENAAIHSEISAETKRVDILRSENVRMQTEIESKSALKSVEEYAVNVLGMQKLDKSQIEYLSLENGNVVDIPDNSDNLFVRIKHAFEDFVEYLRG
ncbi:MAG: hypothetical protein ACI4J6_12930 [Oscillospiraceae bacterium]